MPSVVPLTSVIVDRGSRGMWLMTRDALMKRTGSWSKRGMMLAGIVALGWSASIGPARAQDPTGASPAQENPAGVPGAGPQTSNAARAAPVYSIEDLSYLLAPIALYPDPLLALVLSASTFPVQVVEADRWISANSSAVAQGDFRQVDAMPWDGSVKALARFPDEIRLLADHLEWSQSLGMAFSLQPSDVAAAVQM